jgi:Uma2 family endonuclease
METVYRTHVVPVDEYHRMAEAGVFAPDSRIELLDGELIERMTPSYPPHAGVTNRIAAALTLRLAGRALVRTQSPITLPPRSEPEPDIVVAALDARGYVGRHPGPDDVQLLIEVSDRSLRFDRLRKLPVYARSGIAEVWIVNLADEAIEINRASDGAIYRDRTTAQRGEVVSSLAFPDDVIAIDELLPPL